MEEIGETRAGMTVRDLYAIAIRLVCVIGIVWVVVFLVYSILGYLAYLHSMRGSDMSFGDLLLHSNAGEIVSGLISIFLSCLFFYFAPHVSVLLERDPTRMAPVISSWSRLLITEMVILILAGSMILRALTLIADHLIRFQFTTRFGGIDSTFLILQIVSGAIGFLLLIGRVPLARFLTTLRMSDPNFGVGDDRDAEPPSAQ